MYAKASLILIPRSMVRYGTVLSNGANLGVCSLYVVRIVCWSNKRAYPCWRGSRLSRTSRLPYNQSTVRTRTQYRVAETYRFTQRFDVFKFVRCTATEKMYHMPVESAFSLFDTFHSSRPSTSCVSHHRWQAFLQSLKVPTKSCTI
jgi:hypothetical protein